MINYEPKIKKELNVFAQYLSAWGDIPSILTDIINKFNVSQNTALEFGVEYGYSTSALANLFKKVIGVDTFKGDIHAGKKSDHFEQTKNDLKKWNNISLIKSDYKDFIVKCDEHFDLIHIDIIHTYEDTFACGDWALNHSNIVLFHDTESFPEIKKVCEDLAIKHNCEFYNYPNSNGLGILVKNFKTM